MYRIRLDYGVFHEPIARVQYLDIMRYKLNRDVKIRETGLVIQPNLYWVAASPDGMVNLGEQPGLIEIKCPESAGQPKRIL